MKRERALSPSESQEKRDIFYAELRRDLAQCCRQFDPLSSELCFNIAQTYTKLESRLTEKILPSGLTLPGLNVLLILRKFGEAGCPLNALSHLLIVSRANITGLIDSLVRKGLVTRTEDVHDRRVVIARTTKKGVTLLESYMPKHYGAMRDMADILTKDEKGSLIRLLTKFRRQLLHSKDN